jgi:hypothetical protein
MIITSHIGSFPYVAFIRTAKFVTVADDPPVFVISIVNDANGRLSYTLFTAAVLAVKAWDEPLPCCTVPARSKYLVITMAPVWLLVAPTDMAL